MTFYERLIADVASPYWWFSVILVNVILSILAAYLKPWIDRVLAKVSGIRSALMTAQNAKLLQRAQVLVSNPQLIQFEVAREQRAGILNAWLSTSMVLL